MSIDTDPQIQEAASPQSVVGRLSLRYTLKSMQARTFAAIVSFTAGAALLVAGPTYGQTLQEALLKRAAIGMTCKEIPNNGQYCTYKFGDALEIGIKDVGGADTIIGFHRSDMRSKLYAAMYFGCVAVVPGKAHPRNYERNYGVFISPKTGRIYSTSSECRETF
jgi:hypothetical protein